MNKLLNFGYKENERPTVKTSRQVLAVLMFSTLILSVMIFSCTPKVTDETGEMTFPGCFEGVINSPRGHTYTMFITVDMASRTIQLLVDTYSIPSGQELKVYCNMLEAENEDTGEIELFSILNDYVRDVANGEPLNPCQGVVGAVTSVSGHDWINNDNLESSALNWEAIVLEYSITSAFTAWSGHTRGWDGIVKGELTNIISVSDKDDDGNIEWNVMNREFAIWEKGFYYNTSYPPSLYTLRAISNFPRILNYLDRISFYLWFGRPGEKTNQPQLLQGDYSIEPSIAYDTYSGPAAFRATYGKSHSYQPAGPNPTEIDSADVNDSRFHQGIDNQRPAFRGTTQGLTRCSSYSTGSQMSRMATGNVRVNSKIRRVQYK